MSTADFWLEFEQQWMERLKRDGLEEFHRKSLKTQDHPELLEDLASLIKQYAMRKFVVIVRVHAFYGSIPKTELEQWRFGAYSYAGRSCAGKVRQWAQEGKLRHIPEIVFATGDTGRQDLEVRLKRDGFENVQFRPALEILDRKTGLAIPAAIPLQAADLLAARVRTRFSIEACVARAQVRFPA